MFPRKMPYLAGMPLPSKGSTLCYDPSATTGGTVPPFPVSAIHAFRQANKRCSKMKPKTRRHAFCDESGPDPRVKQPEFHGVNY